MEGLNPGKVISQPIQQKPALDRIGRLSGRYKIAQTILDFFSIFLG
jgi:hypothetical protein